nr:MAG TPA: hypothetical protein [Caudoviricetes sp.]
MFFFDLPLLIIKKTTKYIYKLVKKKTYFMNIYLSLIDMIT